MNPHLIARLGVLLMENKLVKEKSKTKNIGILAYGSLIDDPGCEIKSAISSKLEGIRTPFMVEFARKSSTRGNAPTLVPVKEGGANVNAVIFVMGSEISIEEARNMLWRRETRLIHKNQVYKQALNPSPNTVCIKEMRNFAGIATTIYTCIEPNIKELTPKQLSRLAIESVGKTEKDRDGISYLIHAKSNGIKTPLMKEYEKEILRQTKTENLEAALGKLQLNQSKTNIRE
jgi:cation transport regulator ChaC